MRPTANYSKWQLARRRVDHEAHEATKRNAGGTGNSSMLESPFPNCASNPRCLDRLWVNPMPQSLVSEELVTLLQAKAKPDPEMRTDVLVIGAGPTGLA